MDSGAALECPQFTVLLGVHGFSLVQFSSVAQSCPTLCDPINRSRPGLPVHHHLPEFTQTPITSWQIDGETMETVTNFIVLGSKILKMVTAAMK